MKKFLTGVLAVCLVLAFTAVGLADEVQPDLGIDKNIIIVPGGPGDFRIEVWTDQRIYRPGEQVRIHFRVSQDAFVTLYNIGTGGAVRPIFPNQYERDNFARAGREYTVPGEQYRFVAQLPEGIEQIQAVATKRHVLFDEFWEHPADRVKDRVLEKLGIIGPAQWTVASTSFEIRGRGWYPGLDRGTLRVYSHLDGVQVFLDGSPAGYAPLRLELRPGRHQLVALKPGYFVEVREVWVYPHTDRLQWEVRLDPLR